MNLWLLGPLPLRTLLAAAQQLQRIVLCGSHDPIPLQARCTAKPVLGQEGMGRPTLFKLWTQVPRSSLTLSLSLTHRPLSLRSPLPPECEQVAVGLPLTVPMAGPVRNPLRPPWPERTEPLQTPLMHVLQLFPNLLPTARQKEGSLPVPSVPVRVGRTVPVMVWLILRLQLPPRTLLQVPLNRPPEVRSNELPPLLSVPPTPLTTRQASLNLTVLCNVLPAQQSRCSAGASPLTTVLTPLIIFLHLGPFRVKVVHPPLTLVPVSNMLPLTTVPPTLTEPP